MRLHRLLLPPPLSSPAASLPLAFSRRLFLFLSPYSLSLPLSLPYCESVISRSPLCTAVVCEAVQPVGSQ